MADSNQPALRRSRRSIVGVKEETIEAATAHSAVRTPRRTTKRVRFSDPGPSPSSGLTPMIRRTCLTTPTSKRRRVSTPARHASKPSGNPSSVTKQPQLTSSANTSSNTLDGRIQRRLHRSHIRDLQQNLELAHRRTSLTAQSKISALQREVTLRDREIHELQNATIVIDTDRIWELERQVQDLQREVDRRRLDAEAAGNGSDDGDTEVNENRSYDWTMAARDPFEDFMDMASDAGDEEEADEHFGNATIAHFACSTPSKATRSSFPTSSFPTPPATSPTAPATPSCRFNLPPTPPSHSIGVQASLADLEKTRVEEELVSLQLEMAKLTDTLDSYKTLTNSVETQLSDVTLNEDTTATTTTSSSEPSLIDTISPRVAHLLTLISDRTAALNTLTAQVTTLGFPGPDANIQLTALTTHLRTARLELEYLTPGEISLPLTSHAPEVLDLLLTRLRSLATLAKESDATIDEYHALELSLRQQLDTRVSVMETLNTEMSKAQTLMSAKDTRIRELEVANSRLKGAVSGYIRDISELESLVTTLDGQATGHTTTLSNKDDLIEDLEVKLTAASQRSAAIQSQIATLNKTHGTALALRDARVGELRCEIDRVNEAIRAAHETIRVLRVENGGLQGRVRTERAEAKAALDAMKEELQRVLQMSHEFLNTPKRKDEDSGGEAGSEVQNSPSSSVTKVVSGSMLAGDLARRGSKQRRRYDSGLGFMDDEEVEG